MTPLKQNTSGNQNWFRLRKTPLEIRLKYVCYELVTSSSFSVPCIGKNIFSLSHFIASSKQSVAHDSLFLNRIFLQPVLTDNWPDCYLALRRLGRLRKAVKSKMMKPALGSNPLLQLKRAAVPLPNFTANSSKPLTEITSFTNPILFESFQVFA